MALNNNSDVRNLPLSFLVPGCHILAYNKTNKKFIGTNSNFYSFKVVISIK